RTPTRAIARQGWSCALLLEELRRAPGIAEVRLDHLRIARDRLRRAPGDLLPVVEHHDAVTDIHHRVHEMLDHDHRHSLLAQRAEHREHLGDLLRVEARQDLVGEEEHRPRGEGARELEPLLLSDVELSGGDLALVDAEGHRVAGDQTAETHGDALNVEDHWMYARSRGNRLRSDPTSPAVTKSTVRSSKSPAIASWKFANVAFVMRKPRSHS